MPADEAFTDFAFAATGASALRTMPDRLNDVVNVKDWGATGDGVTDDFQAIQDAIDYAKTLGTFPTLGVEVFVPPGNYFVSEKIVLWTSNPPAGTRGGFNFRGAGRDATRIFGTVDEGSPFPPAIIAKDSADTNYDSIDILSDMTIENLSQTPESQAVDYTQVQIFCLIENVKLIGNNGFVCGDTFGISLRNCIAISSGPQLPANSTTPGPPAYEAAIHNVKYFASVGFSGFQASFLNCYAEGFAVGFAMAGPGSTMIACQAYRCTVGAHIEVFSFAGIGQAISTAGTVMGCTFDRCKWGLYTNQVNSGAFLGNIVKGILGPIEPATISGMSWNSGSHVVTVTTTLTHNLSSGSVVLANLVGAAWTPDGTGTQIVAATVTGANTFTYPGPSSNPDSFTSGSWTYPQEIGIYLGSGQLTYSMFGGNYLPATVSLASVWNTTGILAGVQFFSTEGPGGWRQQGHSACLCAVNYRMCGALTSPTTSPAAPFAVMNYADLPGEASVIGAQRIDGASFTIINANSAAFGATVTGGGSSHYKVRWNGSSWLRVG